MNRAILSLVLAVTVLTAGCTAGGGGDTGANRTNATDTANTTASTAAERNGTSASQNTTKSGSALDAADTALFVKNRGVTAADGGYRLTLGVEAITNFPYKLDGRLALERGGSVVATHDIVLRRTLNTQVNFSVPDDTGNYTLRLETELQEKDTTNNAVQIALDGGDTGGTGGTNGAGNETTVAVTGNVSVANITLDPENPSVGDSAVLSAAFTSSGYDGDISYDLEWAGDTVREGDTTIRSGGTVTISSGVIPSTTGSTSAEAEVTWGGKTEQSDRTFTVQEDTAVDISDLAVTPADPTDGETIDLTAQLSSDDYSGSVTVTFYWDGDTVDSTTVDIGSGDQTSISMEHTVSSGNHTYTASASYDGGEDTVETTVEVSSQSTMDAVWTADLGETITTQPVVRDDTVYVLTSGTIHAVHRENGSIAWQESVDGSPINEEVAPAMYRGLLVYGAEGDGYVYAFNTSDRTYAWNYQTDYFSIFSTPNVTDGTVYIGSNDGSLHAIDAATGSGEWQEGLGGDVWVGPTVAGDTVYGASSGSGSSTMYALDQGSGSSQWSTGIGEVSGSIPVVHDGVVVTGAHDGLVYALDTGTGDTAWTYDTGGSIDSAPAAASGTVYIGSDSGSVYALGTDGTLQWSTATDREVKAGPVVHDGIVYVGSDDTAVYGLDAATGEKQCTYDTGGQVAGSAAVVGGRVYIGSGDGMLHALTTCGG